MSSATTLITAPLETQWLHNRAVDTAEGAVESVARPTAERREFQIQSADSFIVRQSANMLLQQRYGWRGYQTVSLPADQTSDRVTLTAIEGEQTIGTITVGMTGQGQMNCEEIFAAELADLRKRFPRICEFTKLAIDPGAGTHRVMAALFHVSFIVAHCLRQFDAVVMEVNPRHVRFYERMLGGKVIGEPRTNKSVNAPAVLLVVDFSHVRAKISELGGNSGSAERCKDRSLYPLFFSQREEQGILARLMAVQQPASATLN